MAKKRSRRAMIRERARTEALKESRPDIDWDAVAEDFYRVFPNEQRAPARKKVGPKVATYLLSASVDGPTKVGVAIDVEKRRVALQTGHPYPLGVHSIIWFSSFAAAFSAEQWLLKEVDSSVRLAGEWIAMPPATLREMLLNYARRHLSHSLLDAALPGDSK